MKKKILLTAATVLAFNGSAFARDLPKPQSDNDPVPQAPMVSSPDAGLTEQAGIGGTQAYARAGVLELGGTAGLTIAKGLKEFNLSPSIGWFIANNWQLSTILSLSAAKVKGADMTTVFSLVAEPSFHVPFSNTFFGFAGFGFGVSQNSGSDMGFAMVPRIGIKSLVGRSGLITVDLKNTFATNDIIETNRGTLVDFDSVLQFGAGYTVMW